jgi:tellurite methyltransferase
VSDRDRQRWNAAYAERDLPGDPSPFLTSVAEFLPTSGQALDLAGGTGRNGLFLARRGLTVTIADVSQNALAVAERGAAHSSLSLITQQADFDGGFPVGPWDVLLDFNYLERRLFDALPDLLAPGGVFVFSQPTVTNLERHPRPSRRFLLNDGELKDLLPKTFDILQFEESWACDRYEARLVAQRR